MNTPQPLTLRQLTERIAQAVSNAWRELSDVWVTTEIGELRTSGGHAYAELIQKNAESGAVEARLRATIWARQWQMVAAKFASATGARLEAGQKVMLLLTVNYHPVYGLAATVADVDPTYTLGDLLQRRMQILARLRAEGVADMNRSLPWPTVALRIAVISAKGAAGYGDFIHQIFANEQRLRFAVRLFPAVMQGAGTAASVIAALEAIAEEIDSFDCVVIIRGGGAVTDLASFDDYDLAANVAQFPLPVIIGIGHERDTTVLDFVGNMRVKTPTAAAQWLIAHNAEVLDRLRTFANTIARTATQLMSGRREQLARYRGQLPQLARSVIDRAAAGVSPTASRALADMVRMRLSRQSDRLAAIGEMLTVLSPEATLARGFSITRRADTGELVTSAEGIAPGTPIVTSLRHGSITSTATDQTPDNQ